MFRPGFKHGFCKALSMICCMGVWLLPVHALASNVENPVDTVDNFSGGLCRHHPAHSEGPGCVLGEGDTWDCGFSCRICGPGLEKQEAELPAVLAVDGDGDLNLSMEPMGDGTVLEPYAVFGEDGGLVSLVEGNAMSGLEPGAPYIVEYVAVDGDGDGEDLSYVSREVYAEPATEDGGIQPQADGEAMFSGQVMGFAEAWGKAIKAGSGTVTLLTDVCAGEAGFGEGDGFLHGELYVPGGKSVILDLNGFTLSRELSGVSPYGGILQVSKGGSMDVKNGTLSGARASGNGGALYLSGRASFYDVDITGCSAKRGGGMYIARTGDLAMRGGSVTGCSAKGAGGAWVRGKLWMDQACTIDGNTASLYSDNLGVARDSEGRGGVSMGNSFAGSSVGISSLRDDLQSGSVAGKLLNLPDGYLDCFHGDADGFHLQPLCGVLLEVRDTSGDQEAGFLVDGIDDVDHRVTGTLADMYSIAYTYGGGACHVALYRNAEAERAYPGDAVTSWGEGYGVDGGHTFLVPKGFGVWLHTRGYRMDRGLDGTGKVSVNGRGFLVDGTLGFVQHSGSVFTGFYGRESGFVAVNPSGIVELQGCQVYGNGCSVGYGGGFHVKGAIKFSNSSIQVYGNNCASGLGNVYFREGSKASIHGTNLSGSQIGIRVEKTSQRDAVVVSQDESKRYQFTSDDSTLVVGYNASAGAVSLVGAADCEYRKVKLGGDGATVSVLESSYGTFDECWAKASAVSNSGDGYAHQIMLLRDCNAAGGKTLSGDIQAEVHLNGKVLTLTGTGAGFTVQGETSCGITVTDSGRPVTTSEDVGVIPAGALGAYDYGSYRLTYYTSRLWNEEPVSTKYVRDMSRCGKVLGTGMDALFVAGKGYVGLSGGLYVNKGGGPAVSLPNTSASGARVTLTSGASIMGCGGKAGNENGGGVRAMGGTLQVADGQDVAIGGCKGTIRGGAIYLNGPVNGFVYGLTASGNSAVNGGAIYYNSVSSPFDVGGTFVGNQSSANGGAVYGVGAKMSILGTQMSHNVSGNGGALFFYNASTDIRISGQCEFNQNKATNGGAVAVGWETAQCGTLDIISIHTSFVYNEASRYGGAIAIGGVNTRTKGNVTLQCFNGVGNQAQEGGFLYMNTESEVAVHGVNIHHNSASAHGGGICLAGGTLSAGEVADTSGAVENKLIVQHNLSGDAPEDNLWMAPGTLFGIRDKVVQDSYVGITPGGGYPPAGNSVTVGRALGTKYDTAALMGLAWEYFHPDDVAYECAVPDAAKSDLVVRMKESVSEDVGEDVEFDGVLVQHYGYVHRVKDKTDGDKNNRAELLDTSGGNLPKNGELYKSKFLYIDPDSGEVLFQDRLTEIWKERDEVFGSPAQASELQRSSGVDYQPSEIWVKRPGAKQKSVDPSDWVRYAYDGEMWVTKSGGMGGDKYLQVEDGDVVRFVYTGAASKQGIGAQFYDYDITDGKYYLSEADAKAQKNGKDAANAQADIKAGRTVYLNTLSQGINSGGNYTGDTWLAFGNSNTGVPHRDDVKADGKYINRANRGEYGLCSFGIVDGLLGEDGLPVGRDGVSIPTLFGDGEIPGKTLYPGQTLEFKRDGNSWLFSGIEGLEMANPLTRFNHPSCGTTTYNTIWTNNFWPMDLLSKDSLSGHDAWFGDVSQYGKVRFAGEVSGAFSNSDDGLLHNSYFGMSTEFTFTVSEDYVGPMEYWFLGDDDMWVYLDGKLVCDIGGVHSRAGQYVDFWDYIPKGSSGTHKIQLFYTERGASGSTCWMQFILPHIGQGDGGPGAALPETGGIGAWRVYCSGAVLLLAVVLVELGVLFFFQRGRRGGMHGK